MIYLDCNATTPMEPEVREAMLTFMDQEYGNEGSRTHAFGMRAKQAVQKAREVVAGVVGASNDHVIFTSGATEANNLAIFGLKDWAKRNNKTHIVSTCIEHKAVLEPILQLQKEGFKLSLVAPGKNGIVDINEIKKEIRDDTFLVAVMHANNETGMLQPIAELAEFLMDHGAFYLVDAAQSFCKEISDLKSSRIDFIVASGHKVYGPKGIGCLIFRQKITKECALKPIIVGGGQENGFRAGTLPVHLIVGFGKACEIAKKNNKNWIKYCYSYKQELLKAFQELNPILNGSLENCMPNVLNVSFPGINSEAAMVALKDIVAISNGSACTSRFYHKSHVLEAMKLNETTISEALRFSWCHLTPIFDFSQIPMRLKQLC